jgi:hypothetical protein
MCAGWFLLAVQRRRGSILLYCNREVGFLRAERDFIVRWGGRPPAGAPAAGAGGLTGGDGATPQT